MGKYDNVTTDHETFKLRDQAFWVYNAHDVYTTALLYGPLQRELLDNGQLDYFQHHFWPLVPAVMAMAERGLPIDNEALKRYRKQVNDELTACDDAVKRAADDPDMNINSREQVGKLLFDKLGLKAPRLTETGKRGVSQEDLVVVLRNLRKKDEHAKPVLMDLFHRSKLNTLVTRYLNLKPEGDWIFPRVKLYGAETGRLAYADPAIQQWPPSARHIFKAPLGMVFVGCDYSQIEAKILAILSNDEISLEVFARGGDVHRQNAQDLFGLSDAQWEDLAPIAKKAYRNYAKTFLYGISYGGNPLTIHTKLFCPCPRCEADQPPTLDVTPQDRATASARWFYLHRNVSRWQEELLRSVCGPGKSRVYINPLGRRRVFFEPWPTCERPIKNAPMQMTAASIMDRAMVALHRKRIPLCLQMHDQFMALVPLNQADHTLTIMREVMETPIPELNDYIFNCDAEMGDSWGTMVPPEKYVPAGQ